MAALADRVAWPVTVSVLGAIAGVAWYSLGRAMAVPHVFADELIHGEAARNLALHGSLATHGYGFVTPAIDSVAFLVTSNDVAAHEVMQAINVFAVVAAAFLAYPLARRALSPGWALVVSGLTLTVPWITYARFVLTEPDFYPVFLLFALALVRALERPSLKRQLLVLAALLLTYLTRTQAVVLAAAIVVAVPLYGLARGHVRETLKAFAATWSLYLLGAVGVAVALAAGLWSPLGPYRPLLDGLAHPHGLAIWAAANLGGLFLGLGVLVGVAAPLGAASLLRRTSSSEGAALAAVTVSTTAALLASVTLLSESPFGQGSVHERDLFFAAPLIISCALAWVTNGCPRPRLLTAVTVIAVIGCAATIPAGAITAHSFDALSFKLWSHEFAHVSPRSLIILATTAGALAVLTMRSAWPLVVTLALAAVGVAAASDYRSPETQTVAHRYGWVDRAIPRDRRDHAAVHRVSANRLPCDCFALAAAGDVALHGVLQLADRPGRPLARRQRRARAGQRDVRAPPGWRRHERWTAAPAGVRGHGRSHRIGRTPHSGPFGSSSHRTARRQRRLGALASSGPTSSAPPVAGTASLAADGLQLRAVTDGEE